MKSHWIVLVAAVAVGVALTSSASSAPGSGKLYGTDGSRLLTIDPTTGVGTIVGPLLPALAFGFTSLATDSTGTMYAVGGFPSGVVGGVSSRLFTVDPGSGQTVAVGELGSGGSDYTPGNFLGMDSFGARLFAAQNDDYWPGADSLVAVDPAAVAATAIGTFGNCTGGPIDPERHQCSIEGMDALAFDASGTLYGAIGSQHQWWPDWPSGSLIPAGAPGLYKIDPVSGVASCNTWPFPSCFFHVPIVDASGAPPAGGVVSLQFACDQTLYGGTGDGRLLTIDPLSGRFAYVGSASATGGSPLLDLAFERSSCLAPPPIEVSVDIKPGSTKNRINLSHRGVVPVAVLTTDSFDATTVDAGTVCFGDDDHPSERACMEAHRKGHIEDVNEDGRPDLLLHYRLSQTGIDPGDAMACLTGNTLAGVSIEGCDSITTVSRRHSRCDRGEWHRKACADRHNAATSRSHVRTRGLVRFRS